MERTSADIRDPVCLVIPQEDYPELRRHVDDAAIFAQVPLVTDAQWDAKFARVRAAQSAR